MHKHTHTPTDAQAHAHFRTKKRCICLTNRCTSTRTLQAQKKTDTKTQNSQKKPHIMRDTLHHTLCCNIIMQHKHNKTLGETSVGHWALLFRYSTYLLWPSAVLSTCACVCVCQRETKTENEHVCGSAYELNDPCTNVREFVDF